jgi:hypothetical protein
MVPMCYDSHSFSTQNFWLRRCVELPVAGLVQVGEEIGNRFVRSHIFPGGCVVGWTVERTQGVTNLKLRKEGFRCEVLQITGNSGQALVVRTGQALGLVRKRRIIVEFARPGNAIRQRNAECGVRSTEWEFRVWPRVTIKLGVVLNGLLSVKVTRAIASVTKMTLNRLLPSLRTTEPSLLSNLNIFLFYHGSRHGGTDQHG